jgi:lantibiotic biosynthesis protein
MYAEIAPDGQNWQLPQDTEGDHYHRPGVCAPFAWCNGVSGVARAFWLAGRALGDDGFTAFAQEGIAQAVKSFKRDPLCFGPSLCHGVAGLLQVCARFAGETKDVVLAEDIQALLQRTLELFEPDRPFGYRSFEPEYIRVDTPWLLDGASGVALTLLSLLSPVAPTWDRILLLG